MRQIHIDLTTDKVYPKAGCFIGYIGEHNATELLITIPQTMVTESDYQVLVFQSGPMVFRSGHITEDKSKKSYRVGNVIHTVLSKSVTQVTALALQVECYKVENDGEISLIGKTQTTPNLMLKPSPDGFPAFNYEGSYEELDEAVSNSHKHGNAELLNKFALNEEGNLTFDGHGIGDGGSASVKKYGSPSEFPETEKIGTIAYAENDDEAIEVEPTIIEPGKIYERVRLKYNTDITSLEYVKDFVPRSESEIAHGETYAYYSFAREDGTRLNIFGILHNESGISVVLSTPHIFELTKMFYGKDELIRQRMEIMYVYNPVPDFQTEEIDGKFDVGWYRVISGEKNFSINEDYEYSSDYYGYPEKISKDDIVFATFHNVMIIPEQECLNDDLQNDFLTKLIEVVPPPVKKKGLYIFTELGWTSIDDYIKSSTKIVNTFADLPNDCPVGTLAHVLHEGGQVNYEGDVTIYKDNIHREIYFAPFPNNETFLFDFSVHGNYVEGLNHNFNGQFDVTTRLDLNLITVAVTESHDSREMKIYNYSLIDQTITADGYTGHLYKGWNRIYFLPDGSIYVKPITNIIDVPFVTTPTNRDYTCGYQITSIEINGEEASKINTYFFSKYPLVQKDNGVGLWVKTEEGWTKTENPEDFVMKEV